MTDKSLDLALRIKTDLEDGKKELADLKKSLEDVGKEAQGAGTQTDALQKSVNKLANDAKATNDSSSSMKDGLSQINKESSKLEAGLDKAAASIGKINTTANASGVEKLTDSLADVEHSTATASTGADHLRNSAQLLIADMKAFGETLGRANLSVDEIAEQEKRLDRLMAAGAITAKEYDAAISHLDKSENALSKEHDANAKSLEKLLRETDAAATSLKRLDDNADKLDAELKAGRITVEQYNRAMANIGRERTAIESANSSLGKLGLNSREARSEMLSLLRDLSTGNWEQAGLGIARLSQRSEEGALAFARFALPVLAAGAAVAAFAAISYSAWQDQRELQNALIATGNAAGFSEQSFNNVTRSIEQSTNATVGQARDITLQLANTGKFSADAILTLGKAAAVMQQLTGDSAENIAKDFEKMEDGVAKWVLTHNQSLHFVTVDQYNYIRSLEESGDKEGAILAASTALYDSKAKLVADSLGKTESWLIRTKKAASDYLDAIKKVISGDSGAKLDVDKLALASREQLVKSQGKDVDADPLVTQLRQKIQFQEQKLLDAEEAAKEAGRKALADSEAIVAADRVHALSLSIDREKKMADELRKLEEDFKAATKGDRNKDNPDFSAENKAKLEKDIRDKYADKAALAKAAAQAKASEDYVKKLELEAASIGKTADEVRLLKLEEHKLTDEQQMRANGALIQINAEKERQEVLKDSIQLDQIRVKLLKAQGKEAEAAGLAADEETRKFRERLIKRGNTAGVDLIDSLINIEKLKGKLDEVEKNVNKTFDDLSRQETSINTQREVGLISEYEARQKLLELHRATYQQLEKQRPLLEELAKQPGEVGVAAKKALDDLITQEERLQATTSLFTSTLKQGLESGLTDAIVGLADGTKSFSDAIRSLAQSVTQALSQMAAKAIAEKATSAVMGLFGGEKADPAAGAAAVTASAAALSLAGGTLVTGAAAIEAAAASLAAANAAGGVSGGSDTSSYASLFSSFASVFAADGGHIRGPGTSTSDSIPAMLSDYEFVSRAAVVRQPGALEFLNDFNARGMAALNDWSRVHHSTGGLAGVPAPSMPSPTLSRELASPANDNGAQGQGNGLRIINVVDKELMNDYVNSAAGERVLVNMIRRNANSLWGKR